MEITKQFTQLVQQKDLSTEEVKAVVLGIIDGTITSVQAGAFLVLLAAKGETKEEIVGVIQALQEHMVKIKTAGIILDTCGTGGDGMQTINVSTISAFVCAAAGVQVAKHGNRSVSSKCGSFDVLEALGVHIEMNPKQAAICLKDLSITTLYARTYHPAMKMIAPVRKELGIKTVFNKIGPLLNPAGATHQIIGVGDASMMHLMGEIALEVGVQRVLVVHSDDGLDEISIAAKTRGILFEKDKNPEMIEILPPTLYDISEIQIGSVEESAKRFKDILEGNGSAAENECIAQNAGAGLYVAGHAATIQDGRNLALEILKNGSAADVLKKFITHSNAYYEQAN